MKKYNLLFVLMLIASAAMADIPSGYYNSLEGKSTPDQVLATLFAKISSHTDVGYDGLYRVYPTSDVIPGTNQVWDMYSTCTFTHGSKKCGSYSGVCDCYNREHSVPQSWFGEKSPMKSDAFHVIPTDGKVNNQRGNYPLGECANGTYLNSKSLGRLGSSTFPGFSGKVFEVDDEYKGDFARAYFYMVACYRDRQFTSSGGNAVFTYSKGVTGLTTYAINLFMKWHRLDPVSDKEIDRNEAIYAFQHNRNPFIDHPCLAEYIWGTKKNTTLSLATLDNCDGTTPTPPDPDTTMVDTGFHLLPVTNVHTSSVTLNWTSAHATYYTIDVFTKTESGTSEITLLDDKNGTKAQTGGYTTNTDKEGNGQMRLGSGKNTGSLTYSNMTFSDGGRVVVSARYYNNDNGAKIKITAGTSSQTFTLQQILQDCILDVVPQSSPVDVVIETVAKGARAYIAATTIIAGGTHTELEHVTGYPMNVGNVCSFRVDGLLPMEEYFYTVTPQGQDPSEEGIFMTEEGWTGWDFVPFPELDWRINDGSVTFYNVPADATIFVYDAFGYLIDATSCGHTTYTMHYTPSSSLYLITVRTHDKQQTIKLLL